MKKIICIVIAAIILVTICFASDNLYSVEDFTIDNSIELPEFISTTVASLPETDSFLILKFTDTQYIGYNRIDYTYYSGAFLMITSSTNVNWSSYDGVCSYELAYIVDHKGAVRFNASTTTSYNFDPSKAIIVNYRNFNVDGEVFTSIDDYIADKEEKEYKSGVFGWFQKLFDKIADLPSAILNGLKDLFVPSVNPFTSFYDIVIKYFPFIDQVKTLVVQLISPDFYGDAAPSITIDFSSFSWGGGNNTAVSILDLSWYEPFKPLIHGIIIALSYGFFIFRLTKRLPALVTGNTGG